MKKMKAKNKRYEVQMDYLDNHIFLTVTHNSYQCSSIRIIDPSYEIPLIINTLQQWLEK